MMKVVKKWKVQLDFEGRVVEFWVHDDHFGNVLRQVASIQFTENGLEQPKRVVIE